MPRTASKLKKVKDNLNEANGKLAEAEGKLAKAEGKLKEANLSLKNAEGKGGAAPAADTSYLLAKLAAERTRADKAEGALEQAQKQGRKFGGAKSVHKSQCLEDYLAVVDRMYFSNGAGSSTRTSKPETELPATRVLGMITSPLRTSSILDRWTPLEVAVFESAICVFGKDFARISESVSFECLYVEQ